MSIYQLNKAKFEVERHTVGVHELKRENAELKKKIKRYVTLIEEAKVKLENAEIAAGRPEELNEQSVTRKLGGTQIDDISDLELNSAVLNRSIEGGEPRRVAEAVRLMGVSHAVVTSVNRDERQDGGAPIFA